MGIGILKGLFDWTGKYQRSHRTANRPIRGSRRESFSVLVGHERCFGAPEHREDNYQPIGSLGTAPERGMRAIRGRAFPKESSQQLTAFARTPSAATVFGDFLSNYTRKSFLMTGGVALRYTTTKLFADDPDSGLTKKALATYAVTVSAPEHAIMEVLYLVPVEETFEEATLLMEGLTTLRPRRDRGVERRGGGTHCNRRVGWPLHSRRPVDARQYNLPGPVDLDLRHRHSMKVRAVIALGQEMDTLVAGAE